MSIRLVCNDHTTRVVVGVFSPLTNEADALVRAMVSDPPGPDVTGGLPRWSMTLTPRRLEDRSNPVLTLIDDDLERGRTWCRDYYAELSNIVNCDTFGGAFGWPRQGHPDAIAEFPRQTADRVEWQMLGAIIAAELPHRGREWLRQTLDAAIAAALPYPGATSRNRWSLKCGHCRKKVDLRQETLFAALDAIQREGGEGLTLSQLAAVVQTTRRDTPGSRRGS